MRTIYMLTAFDGTDFHGWQRQTGVRTVQDVLEDCLRHVVRHAVSVFCSGRTDAGVHAAGHVASFATSSLIPAKKIRLAMCSRIPADLSVMIVRDVSRQFHATTSAVSKLYRYRIHYGPTRPVEHLTQRYAYHFWLPLSLEAMREAAQHFVGEMDFSAMAASRMVRKTMVRTVLRFEVEKHIDEIRFDVEGTGFLHNQVRNMVGTLLHVGRGHWKPDDVRDILASKERARGGPCVPAKGLCLMWVKYPAHLLRKPNESAPVPMEMRIESSFASGE